MAVDSFSHSSSDALQDLDPLSRALLDLSLQRGMDDAAIAEVLGTDEEAVFEVRVGLLRGLAQTVAPAYADGDLPELEAVVAERIYAPDASTAEEPEEELQDDRPTALHAVIVDPREAEPAPEPKAVLEPEPEPAPEPEPYAEPVEPAPVEPAPVEPATAERRRRSPLVLLLPLLILATLAALVIALMNGGDDEKQASEPAAREAAPAAPQRADSGQSAAAKAPKPRAVRMTALRGGARGTAALDGNRLKLKLRGLAAPAGGTYEVWLYDSVIDARSLGRTADTKIDLDARLPGGAAKDYEWVDVSLEPADGNRNHSGQSVLRVPLDELGR